MHIIQRLISISSEDIKSCFCIFKSIWQILIFEIQIQKEFFYLWLFEFKKNIKILSDESGKHEKKTCFRLCFSFCKKTGAQLKSSLSFKKFYFISHAAHKKTGCLKLFRNDYGRYFGTCTATRDSAWW